jgi:release factor glutamine methyltransferase
MAPSPHSPPAALPSPGPSPESAPIGVGELLGGDELLAWRSAMLALGGRGADLDWLLDLAGGIPWAALQRLILSPKRPLRLKRDRAGLEALWRRHLHAAEPLQYLVGVCPWRDLELVVAPGVLIPRQETELLVDLARQALARSSPECLWADLGTGSGCLAIALALALPTSSGLATDLSVEALSQAAGNLERHRLGGRVQLRSGSWWQALEPWWGRLDLVVANPPYIPSALLPELDPVVRDHEPWLALDGGADGLASLRPIVAGAARALAPGGVLLLEHHHDQSAAVLTLLQQAGLEQGKAHADLEGVARFAEARRPRAAGDAPWAEQTGTPR